MMTSNSVTTASQLLTQCLLDFPFELLQKIFIEVDSFSDLLQLSTVCKKFRLAIYDEFFLNKYFRKRYQSDKHRRNLIGYWKFDDDEDIGKDSSLVKPSYSVSGHGSSEPSLLIKDCDLFNKCIEFDGLTMTNFSVFDKPEYQIDFFSISLWLSPGCHSLCQSQLRKPAVSNGKGINHQYPFSDPDQQVPWQIFLSAWQHSKNKNWILMCIDHYNTILTEAMISDNQCSFYCSSAEELQEDRWYHIVTRQSRNEQNTWINGKLCGHTDMTRPENIAVCWHGQPSIAQMSDWDREQRNLPHTLTLGAKNGYGTEPYKGRMADLSIWNRWLSPLEIRTISEQKRPIDQIQVGTFVMNYCP